MKKENRFLAFHKCCSFSVREREREKERKRERERTQSSPSGAYCNVSISLHLLTQVQIFHQISIRNEEEHPGPDKSGKQEKTELASQLSSLVPVGVLKLIKDKAEIIAFPKLPAKKTKRNQKP